MGGVHRVLVGITGGIAAYKTPLLVRLLRKNGCEVKTALTAAAKTLVGAGALRTLSGNPVYLDCGEGGGETEYDMGHIRLSEWADVFLICPATANTIAKIASGIADNLLSTLALSIPEDRIIVAPAMNSVMWANSATRANINTLAARGVTVLPVGEGELACGASGPGRMLEIEEIARRVLSRLDSDKSLIGNDLQNNGLSCDNKTPSVSVKSGNSLYDNELRGNGLSCDDKTPSVSGKSGNSLYDNELRGNGLPCDDKTASISGKNGNSLFGNELRGNGLSCDNKTPSVSGKDGNSLYDNDLSPNNSSSALKGKTVLISSGPTEEPLDPVRVITNRSSGKMGAALAKAALAMGARVVVVSGPAAEPLPAGAEVVRVKTAAEMGREMGERFGGADICVMAAAVSDYRPLNFSGEKMRRSEKENITIELAPNPDILAGLGAAKSARQFLAGFALESGGGIDRAAEKMRKKKCDMMVFNTVDAALGGDSTGFTILYKDGGKEVFSVMGKDEAAMVIFNKINELILK